MSTKLGLNFDITSEDFQLGVCKFDSSMRELLYVNPHCIEYFCVFDSCSNCSQCYKHLKQKYNNYYDKLNRDIPFTEQDKSLLLQLVSLEEDCNSNCFNKDGIIYGIRKLYKEDNKYSTHNIDKIKGIQNLKNFKRDNIIEKVYSAEKILNELDPKKIITYELTKPKTTTVIKWGQLKLFLEVLFSFVKVLAKKDINSIVHVIYAGSAPGTSLIKLCELLPCLKLYLIDPREQCIGLHGHPNVVEIKNQYFTNETAEYYKKLMIEPKKRGETIVLMSDIRISTDDESINRDNTIQSEWRDIIEPTWSFFKFRCPYNAPNNKIKYFDADYYFQPFAPISSTETRVLVPKKCEMKSIDIIQYQRICLFHNRVLRPSYYNCGVNYKYFDKCYDCSFFKQILEDYNVLLNNKNIDIHKQMENICNTFEKTDNKLEQFTKAITDNILK